MGPACSRHSRSCKQLLLFLAGPALPFALRSLHFLPSFPAPLPCVYPSPPSLPPLPPHAPPRLNCTCCVSCASGPPQRSTSTAGRSHTAGSGSRSRPHTHAHGCRQGVMAEGGSQQLAERTQQAVGPEAVAIRTRTAVDVGVRLWAAHKQVSALKLPQCAQGAVPHPTPRYGHVFLVTSAQSDPHLPIANAVRLLRCLHVLP